MTPPVSAARSGRSRKGDMLALAGGIACVMGIAGVRPALAERYFQVRAVSNVYALPPPEQTVVMTLGYRSAVADFIYAHVLVAYGLHFQERRRFEHVADYLETVMVLDPAFVQPYMYADTLITLQPKAPRQEDYRRARELLLKGTQALPYHQELWLVAGQYIGYVAPPHLEDAEEKQRWKLEGAQLLARACELASNNPNIPHHCIVAASQLNRSGEREALIQMLTRTLAVNDDEEIREMALGALGRWVGEEERDEMQRRARAFERTWRAGLPFVPKERVLLLGPPMASSCAGLEATLTPDERCAASWRDWAEAYRRRPPE